MTNEQETSIYDQHGGEDCVDQVASSLYARLVMDHEFGPVLMNPALDGARLLRHQRIVISRALGGPCSFSLADLRERCAELSETFGLDAKHCDIMLAKLRQILEEFDLHPVQVEEAIVKVEQSLHSRTY